MASPAAAVAGRFLPAAGVFAAFPAVHCACLPLPPLVGVSAAPGCCVPTDSSTPSSACSESIALPVCVTDCSCLTRAVLGAARCRAAAGSGACRCPGDPCCCCCCCCRSSSFACCACNWCGGVGACGCSPRVAADPICCNSWDRRAGWISDAARPCRWRRSEQNTAGSHPLGLRAGVAGGTCSCGPPAACSSTPGCKVGSGAAATAAALLLTAARPPLEGPAGMKCVLGMLGAGTGPVGAAAGGG